MKIEKEPISGQYGKFKINGIDYRIYWEEAGQGIPLVCLHTAGSDGRQYRALLNDKKIMIPANIFFLSDRSYLNTLKNHSIDIVFFGSCIQYIDDLNDHLNNFSKR